MICDHESTEGGPLTDDEFLHAGEGCRIPGELWTHEAHVLMAWLDLGRRPLDEVIPQVREAIRRSDASLGNPEGSRETITLTNPRLIDERIDRAASGTTFAAFSGANPGLLDRSMAILLDHHSREALFSDEATHGFVEPDLAPLPRPRGG